MDPFVKNFVRASLVWLGVGVLIGLSMAFWPNAALVYRPAHVHANLLGFVSMMIFGVAYHVMPRFTGNPLRSRAEAGLHFWIANLGLFLLVSGWIARVWVPVPAVIGIRAGATASAVGAFLFIHNLWRTLGPLRSPARPRDPRLPLGAPGHG
jgi:cbb3-type cytochrome oxidase subunit 1